MKNIFLFLHMSNNLLFLSLILWIFFKSLDFLGISCIDWTQSPRSDLVYLSIRRLSCALKWIYMYS